MFFEKNLYHRCQFYKQKGVRVGMFNATFNTISFTSWQSVLLVEEPEYPEKNN